MEKLEAQVREKDQITKKDFVIISSWISSSRSHFSTGISTGKLGPSHHCNMIQPQPNHEEVQLNVSLS